MPERIGIVTGVAIWAATFVVCSVVDAIIYHSVWKYAVYLGCGIFLSRVVLRRMILHNPEVMALSGCAAMAVVPLFRLLVTLVWPVTYPIIFLFLGIGKILA